MHVETTIDLLEGHTISFEPDCDTGCVSLLIQGEDCLVRITGDIESIDALLGDLADALTQAQTADERKRAARA
jgi:hypothetical protein